MKKENIKVSDDETKMKKFSSNMRNIHFIKYFSYF